MISCQPRASRARLGIGTRAEYRFGLVLLLLLATFVFLMAGSTSSWTRPVGVALMGATLVASLSAADVSRRLRRIAVLIAAAALLGTISVVVLGGSGEGAASLLSAALVFLAPIAIALVGGAAPHHRHPEPILAALCVYVLFGMLWAFVYWAIGDSSSSGFFAQSITPTSADFLYFSFITQLTVGYGDLTASHLGRACAVLEALIGQMYMVTIVALLVSRVVPRSGVVHPPRRYEASGVTRDVCDTKARSCPLESLRLVRRVRSRSVHTALPAWNSYVKWTVCVHFRATASASAAAMSCVARPRPRKLGSTQRLCSSQLSPHVHPLMPAMTAPASSRTKIREFPLFAESRCGRGLATDLRFEEFDVERIRVVLDAELHRDRGPQASAICSINEMSSKYVRYDRIFPPRKSATVTPGNRTWAPVASSTASSPRTRGPV